MAHLEPHCCRVGIGLCYVSFTIYWLQGFEVVYAVPAVFCAIYRAMCMPFPITIIAEYIHQPVLVIYCYTMWLSEISI